MLQVPVSQEQGRVPVTVIHLQGKMDGSNFNDLIAAATTAYRGGAVASFS